MTRTTAKELAATDKDERYRAPALDKGLDILELLSQQSGGLTRGEIVKALGRGPSEVYRMLERLVARGYVSRSREGDRYALSMKLFVLAHRHPPIRRLVSSALPLMDAFALEAAQSCHLVVPDGDMAIVIAQASCPGNWEFGIKIGARISLLGTGSGQTLLAFQGESARAELVARLKGIGNPSQSDGPIPAFTRYRADGYRIGESQQLKGVVDITVPVLSPDGSAVAVLTCPFIQRLDDELKLDTEQTLARLREVAASLSVA